MRRGGESAHRVGAIALAAVTGALLVVCRLGLLTIGWRRSRRWLVGVATCWPGPAPSIGRIPWAVDVGSNVTPGETDCLPRAIVGEALYAAAGAESVFRLGVRRDADALAAHAWLERDGSVTIGDLDDLDRYTSLDAVD